jgi:hypothetical protein
MNFAIRYPYDDSGIYPFILGFSLESQTIETALDEVSEHNRESVSLSRSEIIDELIEIYNECSEGDWDGYGALALEKDSIFGAVKFITLLPSSMPMPEISAEPSGVVGLEWHKDKNLVFVVTLINENILSYAGIFGLNKTHGIEYFGESIPHILIEHIRRLNL